MLRRNGADAVAAGLATGLRLAQLPPPGDWTIWVILAGRGFGKTRAGAEWVHSLAQERAGRRFALVGATYDAARRVMVEGESGLLSRSPEVHFVPSLRRLRWANGSEASLFSGADPEMIRGSQFDFAWGDEFAHWPGGEAALTNLRMATRLGADPRLLLTTTPLPLAWLKALLAEPGVVVSRGRSRDNAANLPKAFVAGLERRYGGSSIGRQELGGEIVEDLAGALWTRALLDAVRVPSVPDLTRIVVGVDPPAGGGTCGIIVAGLGPQGAAYVVEDASVTGVRPEAWARAVVMAADRWRADRVIAETNNGGKMVVSMLKSVDAALPVLPVHAARGKVARAEPVASLYGEGRVFHGGGLAAVEDQLCGLLASGVYAGPGASPDRADALVWAVTALLLEGRALPAVRVL
ncbi:ATP-binding protein [alpha proteobacterium AAP81b]|nr:ATP-binding protein [alpha proteobacterium AAP81b]